VSGGPAAQRVGHLLDPDPRRVGGDDDDTGAVAAAADHQHQVRV